MQHSRAHRRLAALAAATALTLGFTALTASAATAADVTHTIAEVQGTGATTPLNGSVVTVEGVITADFRNSTASGYRGFFLQDPDGDTTDGASDGIFLYANTANPSIAIGDRVKVTGTAGENFNQTQITATSASAYELVAAGEGVPDAVELPDSAVGSDREAYEGMLVIPETAHLSSSHQLYNFGSLWLNTGDELAVKATETTDAGSAANEIAAANRANRLLVDDGYSIEVTNNAHPTKGVPPYFEADTVVRNGDRFVSPEAGMVLAWGFDDWRLQPQRPVNANSDAEYQPTFEPVNVRTDAPEDVGGDFSVGAFNVFNYFTTFGGDARGADNAEDFAVQQSKIVSAINSLDADIVALMEIENSVKLGEEPDEALADLVGALNDASAPGTWDYVRTPAELQDASTTDFITNAIIYKPAAATLVGDSFADVDETVWDIAREPLAQTFDVDGKVLTVVANHFKSKSPPSGNTAPEPADLQGFFNTERTEQAESLVDFVGTIENDPAKGENVILLGDFNAYHEEDPSQVITGAGFTDLVPDTTEEYTYTFDGELGSLDHAYVSEALADSVTGTDVWTINSPEWSDRGYEFGATEAGTPFRSSDHDPIKIGLSSELAPVEIDLLSVNDFHGRLEAAPPIAGAAVLAGTVDKYRAANPNTVFVGAGDLIGASTFTSFIQQDQPTIDAFNEMGLDASAFGNHEFDLGREDVDERILPAADWDYLSANIYDRATEEPAYDEYYLQQFGDVTVGFIGAMTEELPSLVSPAGIETLEVKPVVPEVNRVADELTDGDAANGEADVIVLLVHEGAATPAIESATDGSAFGRIVTGANANIDAIISGHTHLAYDHEIPIPGTDKVRPVISSGQYGEKFSHTSISVDAATGELLSISAEVLPLVGAADPDPEVAAIVADAVAVAKELGAVKVGDITATFNRAKQTAAGSENRGGESTLGNFVSDVQLWSTRDLGSQIAFMNPGGLRADLKYPSAGAGDPDGNLTYAEAAAVQPFANTLITLDLTGEQIAKALSQQAQPASSTRPFLRLGVSEGFEYTGSYTPPVIESNVVTTPARYEVGAMYLNGERIDPNATYRVTVNSFLAGGGDNFGAFAEGTDKADSGKIDLQSMVDYFVANPVASPDYAQRAIGVTLSAAADAEGYAPGEEVTLSLSSLLFSNGEPAADTVTVSAGDVQLGSGAIDPAVVDTTDEIGRSTVTVTIPEGTPGGELLLTVAVPGNGTSIDVPVTVATTAESIENVKKPTIKGPARVGGTLSATGGKWSVDSPTLTYQWNRDGAPIDGATSASYKLDAADAGAAISVTVTASKDGYTDGTATSKEVEVRKVSSSTSGSLSKLLIFGNVPVTYSVTVRADAGVTPTGEVAIYDGSRKVTTLTLDDDGRASVSLEDLSRGVHLLTARYLGSDQVATSSSWPSLLIRI